MSDIQHLPPIVVECPTCGEKYLISRDAVLFSDKTVLFSDGFFTDEYNWRTPEIIGCVTCELGFLPQNGKIIATPDWEDYYKNWAHLKQAQPPTTGTLVIELRARKNIDPLMELILRKELWYSALHTEAGRALLANNPKFKTFWQASLERLEELFGSTHEDDILLKAEINRQLGRFDKCISLLSQVQTTLALSIKKEASKGNKALFSVLPD